MKFTLVLFRHGEAEAETGRGDHARKLTSRGIAQTTATGEKLAEKLTGPSYFLVSDAARTQQTFAQFKALFPASGVSVASELYLAGLDAIKDVYNKVRPPSDCNTLVVVGHNPGLSMVLATLAGELSGLHTSDAAMISVEADSWLEAFDLSGCWELEFFIRAS